MSKSRLQKIRSLAPKTGAVYGILFFLILFSILLNGKYITLRNVNNILSQSATICILSMAAFLVILSGQIDLSVGAVASLSGMVFGMLIKAGQPLILAFLLALGSGLVTGLINGILAGFTTIPPFIITLATMGMAQSIGMVLFAGTISVRVPFLKWFDSTNLWIVPLSTVFVIILYAVFYYILNYRKFGLKIYAVGGRPEAAVAAGINVGKLKVSIYLISGFLSSFAGLIYVARLNAANPSQAVGLELDSIMSAVLGGTALSGGQGKIQNAFFGAIAIAILRNGMNRIGLRIITQMTIIGLMLIIIISIDSYTKNKNSK